MIDSHAHVAFRQFDADRLEVIERARALGISWLEVGTDLEQSRLAVALARQHDFIWPTAGVHPTDIAGLDNIWEELHELWELDEVVAIGEVGLDYWRGGDFSEQVAALHKFVEAALSYDKPVIFHVRSGSLSKDNMPSDDALPRDAHEDMINFLQSLETKPAGVIHTFSGTVDQARSYLEMGLYLSFSGVTTFRNARGMEELVRAVPPDRRLVETDCPFLAPHPYRGKRNEPSYVQLVVEKIAAITGVSVEEVARMTEENTRRLFWL